MKKLFLIGLMMLTGSAWAEWVMYDWNDTTTYFFDPATIRKDGNMRRVWELVDSRERQKDGSMSLRLRIEYDCKNERMKFLGISVHTEPMARCTVLGTASESKNWTEIAPNTAPETMLKIICAK